MSSSESSASTSHPAETLGKALAAFAGGLLLALLVWLAVASGGRLWGGSGDWLLPANAIAPIRGSVAAEGPPRVLVADAEGNLIIRLSERVFAADDYRTLSLHIRVEGAPLEARLLWRRIDMAGRTFARSLDWDGSGNERAAIGGDPQWRGQVAGLALAFRLQPGTRVAFARAGLHSDSAGSLLAQLTGEVFSREPWVQSSINFLHGGVPNPRAPLPALIFAGAFAAALLAAVLARRARRPLPLATFATIALAGWVLLDLRWQASLFANLRDTAAAFAGKGVDDRYRASDDREIHALAESIRKALPAGVTQVALVSELIGSKYFLGKLRYHLFPLWLAERPEAVAPGSVVAVIESPGTRFDSNGRQLTLADGRTFAATALVQGPRLTLLQLGGR